MSYALFQIIMYVFGGIVSVLALVVFLAPLRLAEKLDRFSLVSIPMFLFALIAIMHLTCLLGLASDRFEFLGDFTVDQYGIISNGAIFGSQVTIDEKEARSFDRNVMAFVNMAIAPFIAFIKLNRKPKKSAT